jgi:hypothetical protein
LSEEKKLIQIMKKYGLSYLQGAHAGMIACGAIIVKNRDLLDPHITFGIAIHGSIERAKTVPFPPVPNP